MPLASPLRRAAFGLALSVLAAPRAGAQDVLQFVFTSDVHYGITRAAFRGDTNVRAATVNAALVRQINSVPRLILPRDGGIGAGQAAGPVDFVAIGGDVANRAEKSVQSAAASWREFQHDYVNGLTLRAHDGTRAQLFVVPGNHDFSNAVGFPKPLTPAHDTTSLAGIYHLMIGGHANGAFDARRDVMTASRSIHGIHFVFLTIWPDSSERAWLGRDLETVAATTPVVVFTHDPPIADPKHFTNPNGAHGLEEGEGFENLLSERYRDAAHLGGGKAAGAAKASTDVEQRELAAFVRKHPNIAAYFHGHSNANEFYVWRGPDGDVSLNTFRVDSPMKGAVSARDERRLSFQLVTIDTRQMKMTVRECLWNSARDASVTFGETKTVSLR